MRINLVYIKYETLLVICVLFFTLVFPCPAFSQEETSQTIAIVRPSNIGAYQDAVEGFLAALAKKSSQKVHTVTYAKTSDLYKAIAQNRKTRQHPGIDLILTVGTETTFDISQKITDIPIVFTMVLDPDSILGARTDIVGASLNIPTELYLKMITEVLPTVKTIGVIYDPKKNAAFIRESTRVAETFKLNIKTFPVNSQKDIPDALKQVSKETDALWGLVDDTVYTSQTAGPIIQYTVNKQLPFIGLSPQYVKAGALCSLIFNNKDVGRQAAELAQQILAGIPSTKLQTTTPEKIDLAINLRTAKLIGVDFSSKIRKNAAIVYE